MQFTKKIPGVLVWVPTWTRSARCAGRSGCRDYPHEGELDSGRRHRGILRCSRHEWLIRFVEHRIGDRRINRLVRKWLKAGVMEEGKLVSAEAGTPQGAVASPLLANIYLHYVFDLWADRWRKRHARGQVIIVRYADDIVIGLSTKVKPGASWRICGNEWKSSRYHCIQQDTSDRVWPLCGRTRARRGLGKPETFNFLGFTHICGRSSRSVFQLKRLTRRDRMRARLRAIKEELQRRMHEPIPLQGKWLRQVVRGYFTYHAVPTNCKALSTFRHNVRIFGEQRSSAGVKKTARHGNG